MTYHECNLNIWHYLPAEVWEKVPLIYERMDGWLGFSTDSDGKKGMPYWYSFNEEQRCISVSIEPSGLKLMANMAADDWEPWIADFKKVATEVLGFQVGEPEDGFL